MRLSELTPVNLEQKALAAGAKPGVAITPEQLEAIKRGEQITPPERQLGGTFVQREQIGGAFKPSIEPIETLLSGAIAEPIAGLAGLLSIPMGSETATQNIQSIRDLLTRTPVTPEGIQGLQRAGEAVEPLTRGLEASEQFLGDVGAEIGGPVGGAIGATIPTAAMTALGVPKVRQGVSALASKLKTNTAKKLLKESAPTIEGLKDAARTLYREIDDFGGVIKGSDVKRLSDDLIKVSTKEGLDKTIHPKTMAAINRLSDFEGNVNLTQIETMRKIFRGAAKAIEPDDARIAGIMVDKIDDFMDGLQSSNFILPVNRGKSVGEIGSKYKDARRMWHSAKKSELIEDAFERAKNQASGLENGLRNQFRALLNNKKKMRGFTTAEKDAMRQVVRGGLAANMAKALGKFGFTEGQATSMLLSSLGIAGGAAIGGTAGAVTVPLVGQLSKGLAQRLTAGNAEFANAIVRAGKNGKRIVDTYIKHTPKDLRKTSELTELLLTQDLGKLPQSLAKQKFAKDALFFASFLQSQKEDKSGQ